MSVEQRSAHSEEWEANAQSVQFIRITEGGTYAIQIEDNERKWSAHLRSRENLQALWERIPADIVYLDITGMSHHVWAPLLKSGLETAKEIRAVYVAPQKYRFSDAPTEGEIFDLSERISGIAPIPGFVSLAAGEDESNMCFVPLLGFEGTRLAYLLEQVQPSGGKVVPVVGVPGFRPEYPFYAYHGNRLALSASRAWHNIRYAIANCPFAAFYAMEDIAADFPSHRIAIAPIGTKPHALGAILYALLSKADVEVVYDHPIRKSKRTEKSARLLVYHVSAFAKR